MTTLGGRTVLLTGAAGGIGAALARELAARGAHLALADRDAAGLEALRTALGGSHTTHVGDLADRATLDELVAETLAAHGGLGVLVCNAGLTVHGPFAAVTDEEVDRVLDVDLRSVLLLVRRALPHLERGGHVVLVSSMAALQPFPHQAIYSAAKAGLRAFGEVLRMELSARGIGVTTVLPGTIATGFIAHGASHDPATSARMAELMRRWGTSPDRVARATARAIEANRAEVLVGWDCRLVALARWLLPPLLPGLLGAATRAVTSGRP